MKWLSLLVRRALAILILFVMLSITLKMSTTDKTRLSKNTKLQAQGLPPRNIRSSVKNRRSNCSHEDVIQVRSPAVYLTVYGGTGNQLFQYACGYALAKKNNWPLYVYIPPEEDRGFRANDRDFALDKFNIPLDCNNSGSKFFTTDSLYPVSDFDILVGTYPDDKIIRIEDYCQSEHYFSSYKEEILGFFVPNVEKKSISTWIDLISQNSASVSVHIRLGDFKDEPRRAIDLMYYVQAMKTMTKRLKEKPTFFIFSDEISIVQEQLSTQEYQLELNGMDVQWAITPEGTSSLQEFYLMSLCKHNIIAASTFGWWSAYLNTNPSKIIIAAHYHPHFFYENGEFYRVQYRYYYYPTSWVTVDPVYLN